jgi:hypothetical protein
MFENFNRGLSGQRERERERDRDDIPGFITRELPKKIEI